MITDTGGRRDVAFARVVAVVSGEGFFTCAAFTASSSALPGLGCFRRGAHVVFTKGEHVTFSNDRQ